MQIVFVCAEYPINERYTGGFGSYVRLMRESLQALEPPRAFERKEEFSLNDGAASVSKDATVNAIPYQKNPFLSREVL